MNDNSTLLLTHALQNPIRKRLRTWIVLFWRWRCSIFWKTSIQNKVASALLGISLNISSPTFLFTNSVFAQAKHMLRVWVGRRTLNLRSVWWSNYCLLESLFRVNRFTRLSEWVIRSILLCWDELDFSSFNACWLTSAVRWKAFIAFWAHIHLSLEHLNKITSLWSNRINRTFMKWSSFLLFSKSSRIYTMHAVPFVLLCLSVYLMQQLSVFILQYFDVSFEF